jgi:hypothetical protein
MLVNYTLLKSIKGVVSWKVGICNYWRTLQQSHFLKTTPIRSCPSRLLMHWCEVQNIFHYADMAGNVWFISSEHSSALTCMLSLGQPKYYVNWNDEWMLLHAVYFQFCESF